MGDGCYGRRLSELLQEQQEPFLLGGASVVDACRRRLLGFCHRRAVSRGRRALGLGTASFCGSAVRRALLAGCFSCGARESFRRLRRAGGIAAGCDVDDDDQECARQLSPVSVLELHSDEESSPMLGDREEDETPSTSGKSSPPPPENDLFGTASPCFIFYEAGKIGKAETGEEYKATRSKLEEQTIISSWERIAGDISRIPMLVELDLAGSAQQWRRLREEEVSQVGASIEAMIFEEMRVEAVRDMLA
ncbi:hypothetical protein E2562_028990 [Oryza meyeriana var. granulata]|uniref:DUF4378 domain-containing protein n=1 Tax=Oryza meyeriana var. granulata TaxID=110450 RepID=A0A6G1DQZ7_9ORYZ|nr:hypothetical protein E2562_028990 [Oryza meyeriana var. granulata]